LVALAAVQIKMKLEIIESQLDHLGLCNLGAFHPAADDFSSSRTLMLLGPSKDLWNIFQNAPEYKDKNPNPVDRWSARVIGGLASDLNARAIFPFGGAPFAPFLTWAIQSKQAFSSKVGMLVHVKMGLMVSYRGALAFDVALDLPPTETRSPCDTCTDMPCLSTCPVSAISPSGYDVATCKDFLKTASGTNCMTMGCSVRRSCPLSVGAHREAAQSALHMQAFKGE
jgi:hypothetical protein